MDMWIGQKKPLNTATKAKQAANLRTDYQK